MTSSSRVGRDTRLRVGIMTILAASTVFTVAATAAGNAAPVTAQPVGALAPWDNVGSDRNSGPGQQFSPGWNSGGQSNPAIDPEYAALVDQRRRDMVDVATKDGAIDGAAIGTASGAGIGAATGAAVGLGIAASSTLVGTGVGVGAGALTGLVVGPIVGALAGGAAGCIAALIFCPVGWVVGAAIVGTIGAVVGPPIGAVAGGLIGAGIGAGVGTIAVASGAAIGAGVGAIIGGVSGAIIGGETAHSEASRLLAQQNYDDLEAFAYGNKPLRSQVGAPISPTSAVTNDVVRTVAAVAPVSDEAPAEAPGITDVITAVAPQVIDIAMDAFDSAPAPVVDAVFEAATAAAPQLVDLADQFGLALNR